MKKGDKMRYMKEEALSTYEACFQGDDTPVSGVAKAKKLCER